MLEEWKVRTGPTWTESVLISAKSAWWTSISSQESPPPPPPADTLIRYVPVRSRRVASNPRISAAALPRRLAAWINDEHELWMPCAMVPMCARRTTAGFESFITPPLWDLRGKFSASHKFIFFWSPSACKSLDALTGEHVLSLFRRFTIRFPLQTAFLLNCLKLLIVIKWRGFIIIMH